MRRERYLLFKTDEEARAVSALVMIMPVETYYVTCYQIPKIEFISKAEYETLLAFDSVMDISNSGDMCFMMFHQFQEKPSEETPLCLHRFNVSR